MIVRVFVVTASPPGIPARGPTVVELVTASMTTAFGGSAGTTREFVRRLVKIWLEGKLEPFDLRRTS